MARSGGWRRAATRGIQARALVSGHMMMLFIAGCGSPSAPPRPATGEMPSAVSLASDTEDQPPPADAGGCNVQLSPTVNLPVPAVLATPGPWQLCGTYGTGAAHLLASSYDSRRLSLLTDNGQVWVLGAGGFTLQGVFAHAAGAITFSALSPDGKLLATVDDAAGRVAIWNVPKHKLLRVLTRPPAAPSYFGLGAAAFSHDGRRLAVVSVAHVDVFDTDTGAPLPISARTDLGGAMSVAFAANDTRLVLGRFKYWGNGPYSGWGGVDVVDAATGDNPVALAKDFYIDLPIIAVSGNGNSIAVGATSASSSITFFDPFTGQVTGDLAVAGAPLALDVDGTRVAIVDPPGPSGSPTVVSVREAVGGAVVTSVSVPATATYPRRQFFLVTPDLTGLLIGDGPPAVLTRIQLKNGRVHSVACGTGHTSDVANLAVSLDGTTLVSTGDYYDNQRRLAWDVATGAPVSVVPPLEQLRSPSATSPDGTVQVAGDEFSQNLELRSTATGELVRTFGPQPSHPGAFDFAPDGAAIASSSARDPQDRRPPPVANVWTVATGALEQSLPIITSLPETDFQAVLFGDVDHLFVAGYGTTARWCRAGFGQ